MADDKRGREKKANDRESSQRKREMNEARDRGDEPEPVHDDAGERLGELDDELESQEYPTTAGELTDRYGDREVETQEGSVAIEDLLESVEDETYQSADDVRSRIQGLIHRG